VKFTHEASIIEEDSKEYADHKTNILKYLKKAGAILTSTEKITRYIKVVEIHEYIDSTKLKEKLKPVFDKYEKIFGIRPYFYANNSNADRLSITLQILTKDPRLILRYLDPFLKDVLFQIYHEYVYLGYGNQENPEEVSI
jgi:protoheme ferro-lyase